MAADHGLTDPIEDFARASRDPKLVIGKPPHDTAIGIQNANHAASLPAFDFDGQVVGFKSRQILKSLNGLFELTLAEAAFEPGVPARPAFSGVPIRARLEIDRENGVKTDALNIHETVSTRILKYVSPAFPLAT
jgi:hypothetical protein